MRLDHLLSMEKRLDVRKTFDRRRFSESSKFVVQFSVTEGQTVGAVNAQGPPVPIPNTEVKLCSAEDTSLETAGESRWLPAQVSQHKL